MQSLFVFLDNPRYKISQYKEQVSLEPPPAKFTTTAFFDPLRVQLSSPGRTFHAISVENIRSANHVFGVVIHQNSDNEMVSLKTVWCLDLL
jgi:hypothetical protein